MNGSRMEKERTPETDGQFQNEMQHLGWNRDASDK